MENKLLNSTEKEVKRLCYDMIKIGIKLAIDPIGGIKPDMNINEELMDDCIHEHFRNMLIKRKENG